MYSFCLKMVNLCVLPTCPTRSDKSLKSDVVLHRFPKPDSSVWNQCVQLTGVSDHNLAKNKRICSMHFHPDDIDRTSKRLKLLSTAIPSKFLPIVVNGEIVTPSHEVTLYHTTLRDELVISVTPTVTLKIKFHTEENIESNQVFYIANDVSIPKLLKGNQDIKNKNSNYPKELKRLKTRKAKTVKAKCDWEKKYRDYGIWKRNECRNLKVKISQETKRCKEIEEKYKSAISKVFTPKQTHMLLTGQKKALWTNEEIGKAISLRYKSNAYEHLRSINFPFPSTRTLQRWTHQIEMQPGILYPVINLLKQEFESASEMERQCVIGFDEMSIESSIVYDPDEDRIYGPKNNMCVWFVRGLFGTYKQPIAYNFDEKFTTKQFINIVEVLEKIGLHVRANVNDLGGKNRGLWSKLGIHCLKNPKENNYEIKSSFLNPVSEDNIWFFSDAPHNIKLLRNNVLKHGITLKGGFKLEKRDFVSLLKYDKNELKMNFSLTAAHLCVKDKEKQRVSLAVQLFSRKVATSWRLAMPNKIVQADFIELIDQWFNIFNSRNSHETLSSKMPFGLNMNEQMSVLDRMEDAVIHLRVGNSETLYPFQRGILISIHSLKGIFHDLSGSRMRISYLLTYKFTQDYIENAFSRLRAMGAFNDNPSAVDAKRRLKLLMLSWGGKISSHAAVSMEGNSDEPFLTGKMISSLVCEKDKTQIEEIKVKIDEDIPVCNVLKEENFEDVFNSMGMSQRFEENSKEYLCGFIASKMQAKYPQLCASEEEIRMVSDQSWITSLSSGGLTHPSFTWRNQASLLEKEFKSFHNTGRNLPINMEVGVLKGFSMALSIKYPDIPHEAILKFIKCRLFIRLKSINKKLAQDRIDERQKRSDKTFRAMQMNSLMLQQKQNVTRKESEPEDNTRLENETDFDMNETEDDLSGESETDDIMSDNEVENNSEYSGSAEDSNTCYVSVSNGSSTFEEYLNSEMFPTRYEV